MSITIYHNPRCSKSRKTLETLEEKGIKTKVAIGRPIENVLDIL